MATSRDHADQKVGQPHPEAYERPLFYKFLPCTTMSNSLVGKVAIVTGSSRSIGAAIAQRLAEVRTCVTCS